jgi:uncharacterized protein (TIGR00369 family)
VRGVERTTVALYFAYGSNMATARLRARAVSARSLGAARLEGFSWRCNKYSLDGTAKANLGREDADETWGVLYEIEGTDLEALDRSEGGYERIAVVVRLGDGAPREAYTYVSQRLCEPDVVPADWYLALVVAGAREHALPEDWVRSIEAARGARETIGVDDPDNACFGCSASNPRGLGLRFERAGPEAVETRYVAAEELCGRRGVVHGGVQAALLDEAMGFAAHAALGEIDLATVDLSLRYRRPTPTGEPLRIRAQLVRSEDRDVWLRGEIRDAEGRVCTEATSRWRQIRT